MALGEVSILDFGAPRAVKDAEARRRIAELEEKVKELEARPQVFIGTRAEMDAACQNGVVRIGDVVVTTDDDEDGAGDMGGTDDTGGADSEATNTGNSAAGAGSQSEGAQLQEGGGNA